MSGHRPSILINYDHIFNAISLDYVVIRNSLCFLDQFFSPLKISIILILSYIEIEVCEPHEKDLKI